MAEMSMNKVIHQAFRRDLGRFSAALAAFDDGDKKRAASLLKAWGNFEDQLQHHHTGEHEIAWPALESVGVSRDVLTGFDTEHDDMAKALAGADAAMKSLGASGSANDAATAREAIAVLHSATETHLVREEAELEPVYAQHTGSAELKAMAKKFAKVSPMRLGRFMAWLQDGATDEEKAALAANVPAPVVLIFSYTFGQPYKRTIAPVWR